MAPRTVPLIFSTSSNPGRYGYDGGARLINAYAEDRGPEGRARYPLYVIDGLASFSTLTGGGGVRAMIAVDNTLYVVAGRLVFSVDRGGTATVLGGLPSDGPVYMEVNRRLPNPQVAVVCDGIYKVISGGVMTEISDADLATPISVTHIDGYFVFISATGTLTASAIDDGTSIDALAFATAEVNRDPGVCAARRGRELLAFGTKSLEFWTNTGAENFPFERANAIDFGTLAGKTVAAVTQTVAFVAHDGTVRVLDGYQAVKISNNAVDRFIGDTTDKSTLSATAWSAYGHSFYALSSPAGTWVYDFATQFWHERQSYGMDRWRVSCVERFGDDLIAGHYDDGLLYSMSPGTYAEGDDPIQWEARAPVTHAFPGRMRLHRVDFDPITGVGTNSPLPENANPTLLIDTSEDGGLTFGGERSVSAGTINQRLALVSSTRFGLVRPTGRIVRFRMSADVVRGMMSAATTVDRWR